MVTVPSRVLALVLATIAASCGSGASSPRLPVAAAEPVRLMGDARLPALDAPTADVARAGEVSPARRLVLITLDGIRHQDIFEGVDAELARAHGMRPSEVLGAAALTPNLHRLMDRGVALGASADAPVVASGPNFASLPGYDELLSGKPSECQRNDCAPIAERTLLDACREVPESRDDQVAMIASWEVLERAAGADSARMFLSTGRHHGVHLAEMRKDAALGALLKRGEKAFPSPGQNDYRPDRFTAPLALKYLQTQPRCLFVGLGDGDELAHLDDYRGYVRALLFADRFVGDVMATLDGMGEAGAETTLWITTDHGRASTFVGHGAKAPESARVWLVAAGAGVLPGEALPIRRLADVAPVIAARMALPAGPVAASLAGRMP